MGGSNENLLVGLETRPSYAQGESRKPISGYNRRALSAINGNIIGARKEVLKEGNLACDNNSVVPVRRPVTRKFGAQLARNEQPPLLEEVKPSFALPLTSHEGEDCIINDTKYDNNPIAYDDVPMFVQHTEAMMEEIDRMGAEIEMQDIEHDELVLDIDSCDKNNPLAATEYVDDLYVYYKKMEVLCCVPTDYMANQFDINRRMRGILIDWLIEVQNKFELIEETLYLTVNLIDRFLAVHSVARKKLQLVGVAAMLIACKYEEISVPVVEDLIQITDRAYSRHEVLEMEKLMMNTLQFNLSLPTPYVFMRRFLKAAQSDSRLEFLSFFIMELCLIEYEMLRFPPSLLAAASIFTARCSLSGRKQQQWSKTSEKYTSYTESHLTECAKLMVSLHQKAGNGKLTGVYNKYITPKYGYAAIVEPALFLKD